MWRTPFGHDMTVTEVMGLGLGWRCMFVRFDDGSDPPVLLRLLECFHAVVHAELLNDVRQMVLDRTHRQEQFGGD